MRPVVGATGTAMRGAKGAIIKHPVLSAAGAAGAIGAAALVEHRGAGAVVMGPAGVMMHMRRHRRMRVTNPKALRRPLRRAHRFARLTMKTIHLVFPREKAKIRTFNRLNPKK